MGWGSSLIPYHKGYHPHPKKIGPPVIPWGPQLELPMKALGGRDLGCPAGTGCKWIITYNYL